MRKILTIFFMLIIFCSSCSAFENPDPSRWLFIGETPEYVYWIDSTTLKFYGNCASVWELYHQKDGQRKTLEHWEMDFSKKQHRLLTFRMYNSNSILINSSDTPLPYTEITPGTIGEEMYKLMESMYQLRKEFGL